VKSTEKGKTKKTKRGVSNPPKKNENGMKK
jgi:hypothetical protein